MPHGRLNSRISILGKNLGRDVGPITTRTKKRGKHFVPVPSGRVL